MNPSELLQNDDTIIALSTASGQGAIAVLRVSGADAISVTNKIFQGKNLEKQESHTLHFGRLMDGDDIVDEVVASLYVAPKSYTGEHIVEISCHGSQYIVRQIIELYLKHGVRYAKAGEFTRRAFLNGKLDLAQAEAVSDLITSDSEVSHRAAMNQMRGGFSAEIKKLREELIHFASLIELELDFSEEDVEFADRDDLKELVDKLLKVIKALAGSFQLGNVIKNGVPTVIAGKPNAGKSTLLNTLLNEEKAIVSDIPGTTRDFIEDELIIGGASFRFIDTAGLRETEDQVEAIGVQRTYSKMKEASLILYLFDVLETSAELVKAQAEAISRLGVPYLLVANKMDELEWRLPKAFSGFDNILPISAKDPESLEELKQRLVEMVNLDEVKAGNAIVTNVRHFESLTGAQQALELVLQGLANNITGDFLAMDIRNALHHLGEITGQITHEDLLDNIFSKFCIGK